MNDYLFMSNMDHSKLKGNYGRGSPAKDLIQNLVCFIYLFKKNVFFIFDNFSLI